MENRIVIEGRLCAHAGHRRVLTHFLKADIVRASLKGSHGWKTERPLSGERLS